MTINELQASIQLWMEKVGQETFTYPTVEAKSESKARALKFTCEEFVKLIDALGFQVELTLYPPEKGCKRNLTQIFDALCNLIVVIMGMANTYGLPMEKGLAEVMRSNWTKLKDGHRQPDGKWVEGPSYEPPDLGGILGQDFPGIN